VEMIEYRSAVPPMAWTVAVAGLMYPSPSRPVVHPDSSSTLLMSYAAKRRGQAVVRPDSSHMVLNYRDQTQRCNSRLDLLESQLRASTSTGLNCPDATSHKAPCPTFAPHSAGAQGSFKLASVWSAAAIDRPASRAASPCLHRQHRRILRPAHTTAAYPCYGHLRTVRAGASLPIEEQTGYRQKALPLPSPNCRILPGASGAKHG
jgi:hypothetical protein